MADQKKITLRGLHATPKNIILRELPVATPSAGTTIRLKSLHATPKNIILGDPTASGAAGPTFILIAAGSTYAFTGGDALFVKTPTFTLTADGGSYAFTGGSALFALGRTLTADGASYSYSAGSANFVHARTLTADGASYAYSAGAANFVHARSLVADGATYSYTAGDALFQFTAGVTFTLLADGATYDYSAGDAVFTLGTQQPEQEVTRGWWPVQPRRKRKTHEEVEREELDAQAQVEAAQTALVARRALRAAEQRSRYVTAQLRAIYAEQDALVKSVLQTQEFLKRQTDDVDLTIILSLAG